MRWKPVQLVRQANDAKCAEEDETSLHIMCYCESSRRLRKQYFGVKQLKRNEMEFQSVPS